MIEWLPHVNVSLNAIATLLLIIGFVLIKQKRETAHRNTMLATFGVNMVFLVCYLTYHYTRAASSFLAIQPSRPTWCDTFITDCSRVTCCSPPQFRSWPSGPSTWVEGAT